MYLKTLKRIRERLLTQLSGARFKPILQKPLSIGAAGDHTFPIDRLAEDIIISELEASGIPLSLISEECGLKDVNGGGKKVLIDPIDGSKNAVSGIPFFCTSIAFAEGGTIGSIDTTYVVNLVNGDEFLAEKGHGAFLNGERIFAQKDDEFYLVAYEAQTPGADISRIMPLLSISRKTRCLGATALDLAYLASGSMSAFVNPARSRSFDFAGGWLLVREAGGVFTCMDGNSAEGIELGLKKNSPFLSSGNHRLHDRALQLLNKQ